MNNGLVIFAKDIDRVSAFYQKTLKLIVSESENSHRVLTGNGIELVIHAIPKQIAAQIAIDSPPVARSDTAIKPAFVVESLAAVRTAANTTGGTLKPLKGAWKIRGATVLDGTDPEGNIVQFKEPETSVNPGVA